MSVEEYTPQGFAAKVFADRYAIHKEETFAQACERVARKISDAEMGTKRDEYFVRFLDILRTNRFSPGGRIWRGAGRPRGQMLNCFCSPAEDSREGWGDVLRNVTIISGTGGGVGINFSKIRPRGTKIRGTGGEATGAVSLMRAINAVCDELREGGGRRCLPKDTLIHTDHGLIPISEIKPYHKVQTMSGKFAEVIAKEYTGEKQLVEIDTQMGKFYSSIDHRWGVLDDLDGKIRWVSARDIQPNDRLIFVNHGIEGIETNLPQYKYNKPKMATTTKDIEIPELTTEIAWFFGQLHGDGHVCLGKDNFRSHVSIACADDLPNQHNRIVRVLKKFGEQLYVSERKGKTEKCSKPRVTSVQLSQYLSQFKKSNTSMDVPDFILCGTRNIRIAYLAGLLDADGYLGKKDKLSPIRIASSIYPDFLRQIRAVLSSLGMVSAIKVSISKSRPEHWHQLYNLEIVGIASIEKFKKLIGSYSCKYIRDGVKKRVKEQNSLTVPSRLLRHSQYKNQFSNIYWSKDNNTECSWIKFQKTIGLRNFQPISVRSIRLSDKTEDTYDIQVLDDEMFVAVGILVHNSALLYCLDWKHPDLLEFLSVKLDKKELNNANISVLVDDEFFELLDGKGDIVFKWQGEERGRISAQDIWDKIIQNAWASGDPGFLNMGLMNEQNTLSYAKGGEVSSTNPCGEAILEEYGCCCLGAINLHTHVIDDRIDWDMLEETVATGVRFLDNVLDQNNYPLPLIQETSQKHRRIGLGIMGLHDMLLELNLKYSSKDARDVVDRVMNFIKKQAYHASIALAIEKGSFHAFDASKHVKTGFVKKHLTCRHHRLIKEHGIRNCAILSIAPTGCQRDDTLVVTKNGILRLNEIIDVDGSKWQKLDDCFVAQESILHKADKGFVNGISKTKKITLSSGIVLEITPNHMIRIIRCGKYIWCRADNIEKNDVVPVRIGGYENKDNAVLDTTKYESSADYNLNKIKYPSILSDSLAWFVGLFYGDGSVHKKGIRIHCHEDQVEIHETLRETVFKEFGIMPTVSKGKGKLLSFCFNSVELLFFLRQNGLLKSKSHLVSIPLKIRQSSPEIIKAFLEGYWNADGSRSGNTKYIDTVSFSMSQDLAICMRAVGINCKIGRYNDRTKSFGKRTLYRVRFVDYGTKHFDGWRYVTNIVKNKINIIKELVTDEFVYDTVLDIEDSSSLTLDISVPDNNCYLSSSVISHNTTSIVAGCSSGIEPLFQPVYKRRFNEHKNMHEDKSRDRAVEVVVHPLLKKFLLANRSIKYFQGAHDISPEAHLAMQATCQRHIDNSISKTINIPEDYSVEQLSKDIRKYIGELKGITVYRDGSKGQSPLASLPLSEAKKHLDSLQEEAAVNDCPSGACDNTKGGE